MNLSRQGAHLVQEWREDRRVEDLRAPVLRDLLALWQSRCGQDGRLPARADFRPRELVAFGGIITLIEIEPAPWRLRVRLVGTAVVDAIGRDNTGRYLDEIYDSGYLPLLERVYRTCIEERRPVVTAGRLKHFQKDYRPYESLDLPLARDGETVDLIMKGSAFGGEEA